MRDKLKTQSLALAGAIPCFALAGCGDGDDEVTAAAYWKGKPAEFCKASVDVGRAGGAVTRLLLQRRVAQPSTTLFVRIENLGPRPLFHGLGPLVEQRVKGRWVSTIYPSGSFRVRDGRSRT